MLPTPATSGPPAIYLGDGVYIRWLSDEASWCLYTSNGLTEENHIYLDPSVAGALVRVVNAVSA